MHTTPSSVGIGRLAAATGPSCLLARLTTVSSSRGQRPPVAVRSTAVILFGLLLTTGCAAGIADTSDAGVSSVDTPASAPAPVAGSYEVVAEYPHDPAAYTQGLFWHAGHLYEGTGRYNTSWLRRVDIESGEVLQQAELTAEFFGEGIAMFGDRIFQLTWLSKRGFVYDVESFEQVGEFSYATEGWGLTSNDTHLILSDGSDRLFFIDPDGYFVTKTVRVTDDGDGLDDINEIEFINGLVFANVWHSDIVYQIDPETGVVVGRIDFSELGVDDRPRDSEAVLNGIAYNTDTGHLYMTGKNWTKLFEIRLIEESP